MNLYWAEFQIPVWRMQGRGWKLWDALTDVMAEDGLLVERRVRATGRPAFSAAISWLMQKIRMSASKIVARPRTLGVTVTSTSLWI